MQPGNIFGVGFGLYLHFDQHLTLDKILQINQAVMTYNKVQDNFRRRILLRNPFVKRDVVKVPRIAPARNQLEPQIRAIEATIGVQASENGRVAFRSLSVSRCTGDGSADNKSGLCGSASAAAFPGR